MSASCMPARQRSFRRRASAPASRHIPRALPQTRWLSAPLLAQELIGSGVVPLRPGVLRVVDEAIAAEVPRVRPAPCPTPTGLEKVCIDSLFRHPHSYITADLGPFAALPWLCIHWLTDPTSRYSHSSVADTKQAVPG